MDSVVDHLILGNATYQAIINDIFVFVLGYKSVKLF